MSASSSDEVAGVPVRAAVALLTERGFTALPVVDADGDLAAARFMGGLTPLIWLCLVDPQTLGLLAPAEKWSGTQYSYVL